MLYQTLTQKGGYLKRMRSKYLIARLRPKKDDDIIRAIKNVESGELSEMIRNGVRCKLKLKNKKTPTRESKEKRTANDSKDYLQ